MALIVGYVLSLADTTHVHSTEDRRNPMAHVKPKTEKHALDYTANSISFKTAGSTHPGAPDSSKPGRGASKSAGGKPRLNIAASHFGAS